MLVTFIEIFVWYSTDDLYDLPLFARKFKKCSETTKSVFRPALIREIENNCAIVFTAIFS